MDKHIIHNAYLIRFGYDEGIQAYLIEFDLMDTENVYLQNDILKPFSVGNRLKVTIEIDE